MPENSNDNVVVRGWVPDGSVPNVYVHEIDRTCYLLLTYFPEAREGQLSFVDSNGHVLSTKTHADSMNAIMQAGRSIAKADLQANLDNPQNQGNQEYLAELKEGIAAIDRDAAASQKKVYDWFNQNFADLMSLRGDSKHGK